MWCFTYNNAATAQTVYRNGVALPVAQTHSDTVVAGDDIFDTDKMRIGNRPNSTARAFDGVIYCIYIWKRELNVHEIRRISEDPFGLIRMAPRRIVKAAAVGGANPHNPLGHPLYGPFAGPIAA